MAKKRNPAVQGGASGADVLAEQQNNLEVSANPNSNQGRPLDEIAADIHGIERRSIFELGDLLIEAKAACEHGQWGKWLDAEFDWSADTAGRYMGAAELGSKFRKLRNLKLATTTLYDLLDEDDDKLPAIVEELAKVATQKQLSVADALHVIWRARTRIKWGDYPNATLVALDDLNHWEPRYGDAVAALKTQSPQTDEEADAILAAFEPIPSDMAEAVAPTSEVSGNDVDTETSAERRKQEAAADELRRGRADAIAAAMPGDVGPMLPDAPPPVVTAVADNENPITAAWDRANKAQRDQFVRDRRVDIKVHTRMRLTSARPPAPWPPDGGALTYGPVPMRRVKIVEEPDQPYRWIAIDQGTRQSLLRLSDLHQLRDVCFRLEWKVVEEKRCDR